MMSRPKVLIVDNSASTCLFIASTLQEAGYEVDIALTGQDSLAKVMKFHHQCLILDALLPDISGYAVCRHLRQSIPEHTVRIILMSIKHAPLYEVYGLRQGADRYLSKPFTRETLLQEVWNAIPEAFRSAVLNAVPRTSQSHPLSTVLNVIPRRIPNQQAMRVCNPFANATVMRDEQVNRLYAAINGKQTVAELAILTGLEIKEIFKILRVLLKEGYIQIYDSSGQIVEGTLLLSALKEIHE